MAELPDKCPECGASWRVRSHCPATTYEGMGRFTAHIDTSKSDAARCSNGHGWPNDEEAPHPYAPPKEPQKNRWGVSIGYEHPPTKPIPGRPGWRTTDLEGVEPSYYCVSDVFGTSKEEVRFGPDERKDAEAFAAERNRLEWQGPLDPEFTERRERLKTLAPDFGGWAHEGPREAQWPVCPGKYLVHDCGVGWHPEDYYELIDDLAGVEAAIAADEANVGAVIDLDTGREVAFDREVVVRFAET